MTVVGQQSIDRALPQAVTEDLPRIVEALLDLCRPECHASNSCRSGRKSRAFGCDYFSSVLELIAAHHVDQERRGLLPTSIEKRDGQLQIFSRYLEPRSLLDAQREDVEQFLDSRNIGARTRYAWLSHLHNFYDWTLREDIGTSDPTVRIIRPKMRRSLPRPAATDQLVAALRVADPMRRCWLLLAAYMGLRCQEIAGIRREDILQDEGLLRVVKGKGGVERMIPIHPEVMAALLALPMPGVGWVFQRPGGGPWPPPRLSQRFNKFLREAGVNGTAHTLRHWFGSNLYAQS